MRIFSKSISPIIRHILFAGQTYSAQSNATDRSRVIEYVYLSQSVKIDFTIIILIKNVKMKDKLQDNFIKERYLKDYKYIHVYDTYTFNYNKTNVTSKFYSKYEGDIDEPNPVLLENLKKAKDYDPKQKIQWPETENQWYPSFTNNPVARFTKLYL